MKTTRIMTFAAALLLSLNINAQPPQGDQANPAIPRDVSGPYGPGYPRMAQTAMPSNEERAKMLAERLKSELGLTDAQAKKIEKVYLRSYYKEQRAKEQLQDALMGILTPDQYNELNQDTQPIRNRMQAPEGARQMPGREGQTPSGGAPRQAR